MLEFFEKIQLFIPELLLAFFASELLLFGAFSRKDRAGFIRYFAVGILVLYSVTGLLLGRPSGEAFQGALIIDDFSHYVKFFIGMAAAAALMFSKTYLEHAKIDKYEYSVLALYAVLGMSIMVSANNMLALYIGVEMQSLALYILAAWNRDSLRASEAGLKYFVLGALSSGLLLYGISMIYGFTGSLEFSRIAEVVSDGGATPGVIAGLVFLLCGLAFKISAAPFHMWTPDVYEGAPTPVVGFFASAPKFAAMALIVRVVVGTFDGITDQWQQVIIALSIMSMFVGAIGALSQTNIKRLMAYSSIANMGYALVALSAGTEAGVRGLLIFMSIYTLTTIGVFACILQMRIRNGMVEQISDLAGLSENNKSMAILLTIFMLSLAGIPPLFGFFGKWFAFGPAMAAGLWWLVVLALIASVIGAFYYLRIIRMMWFSEPAEEFVEAPKTLKVLSTISGLLLFPVLMMPFIAFPGQKAIEAAAASLF